jgi:hypothetical protein
MKRLLVTLLIVASSTALAQIQIQVQVPVIVISTNIQIKLVPNLVVIERVREPQGVLVVYRSNRRSTVFYHHDRDLRSRGWVRVRYQTRSDGYRCEYRRGRAKARLEVKDRRNNRIEVRVHEDD